MKKFGLEAKVVISIILLALFISVLGVYEMSVNTNRQFLELEKSRTTLLINTISPIISLNLSLGLLDANKEYLDEIAKQNPDILMLKISDKEAVTIYGYQAENEKNILKKSDENYFSQDITDSFMNEHVAKIELYISDERYKEVLKNNTKITIEIFFIVFIVLIFFAFFLKKEFLSFKELSNQNGGALSTITLPLDVEKDHEI